jgi:3D (Asp-Asp-Asp) domain-containing protein
MPNYSDGESNIGKGVEYDLGTWKGRARSAAGCLGIPISVALLYSVLSNKQPDLEEIVPTPTVDVTKQNTHAYPTSTESGCIANDPEFIKLFNEMYPQDAVANGSTASSRMQELELSQEMLGRLAKTKQYQQAIWATLTAYDRGKCCCGPKANGYTSTGRDASNCDGVAVDPRAIPYGSVVHISGVGYRLVDDTGEAMRKSWRVRGAPHIDIRMDTHNDAKLFGRQFCPVTVFSDKKLPRSNTGNKKSGRKR